MIVTSGAIARGMRLLELPMRPTAIEELQAASAVGQGKLYRTYDELLRERGLPVRAGAAHVLRHERAHALPERAPHAAQTLLDWRIVPVINENDTTTTDEISFGDNDFLAAQVAVLVGARPARAADRHRRALHRRPARSTPARSWSSEVADPEALDALEIGARDVAARLGRDALEGRGGRDGHRGRASRR